MTHKLETKSMTSRTPGPSLASAACLVLAAPLVLAQTAQKTPSVPSPVQTTVAAGVQPGQKCFSELRAFDSSMQREGYWLHGSGFGFGYPMYGYGFGHGYGDLAGMGTGAVVPLIGHGRVRPGYEIRTLIASANILAQSGQQVDAYWKSHVMK